MVLDAEEKNTGDVWRGDFTAKYIEEISKKTGNFKKFPVFIKMILEALKQQGVAIDQKENMVFHKNQPVSLNLLSQQDLMELKQAQNGGSSQAFSTPSKTAKHDKKYLILTLDGEFEKVHYPMPLQF